LWIWHAAFGFAGSQNDINIWEQSPLLKMFLDGTFATEIDFEFRIDDTNFHDCWFLVDGIYPEIARFAKTVDEPVGRGKKLYAVWQEACRKDVERATCLWCIAA
jgi:Plant transposon protein